MKYIIISFICCLVDLFSKHTINNNLKKSEKREVIPNVLYFINTKNEGVAYNKFETKPKTVKAATAVLTAVFGVFFVKCARKKAVSGVFKLGCALVFGGALGNLVDRLKNNCVTDFIYFKVKKSPIFNLADVFIFFGAVIMAVFGFKK